MRVHRSFLLNALREGATVKTVELLEGLNGPNGSAELVLRVVLVKPENSPLLDQDGYDLRLQKYNGDGT